MIVERRLSYPSNPSKREKFERKERSQENLARLTYLLLSDSSRLRF
jgi:hypothetical protein